MPGFIGSPRAVHPFKFLSQKTELIFCSIATVSPEITRGTRTPAFAGSGPRQTQHTTQTTTHPYSRPTALPYSRLEFLPTSERKFLSVHRTHSRFAVSGPSPRSSRALVCHSVSRPDP